MKAFQIKLNLILGYRFSFVDIKKKMARKLRMMGFRNLTTIRLRARICNIEIAD